MDITGWVSFCITLTVGLMRYSLVALDALLVDGSAMHLEHSVI